jgi:predicted nucleic acid-binding protein
MSAGPTLPDRVVVDTDVVSFSFKRDTRAFAYKPHLNDRQLIISFMTLAELDAWVIERNWGARRKAELEEYLRPFVVEQSDREMCRWWATVRNVARRNGRRIDVGDAWIAATAMFYGIPLVTHNPDDFAGVDGLTVITER